MSWEVESETKAGDLECQTDDETSICECQEAGWISWVGMVLRIYEGANSNLLDLHFGGSDDSSGLQVVVLVVANCTTCFKSQENLCFSPSYIRTL